MAANDSDTYVTHFCARCNGNNTETEAKAYCAKCDSCFCDGCVRLHSQGFQNHTTDGPEKMEKWPVAMATQEFLENCEVHKGKKFALFCEDHSQLCCHTCDLSHRQCSKVTPIANTTLSASDDQQLSAEINTILDQLMKLQAYWKSNLESLQVSYKKRL
ncbi:transcription intermediary factor 1-alpha-like [Dreissena polymorpha]|nr:transcription intermediary factor 1-alpha-like [Dreissena polymorpha]